MRERVASVFGVANFLPAQEVAPDLEALKAAALASLRGRTFGSFRVTTKRSYKGFPKNSGEIDREVGAAVHEATGVRVDLEQPELTLFVEVLQDRIFFSFEKQKGPGGFPVGTSGRVIALLSGGIDSPVAAYRHHEARLHGHPRPLPRLSAAGPHHHRQGPRAGPDPRPGSSSARACCSSPSPPCSRRSWPAAPPRCASSSTAASWCGSRRPWPAAARARALVTGESLGQVASQTLDNMAAIDEAAAGPVLRPLVGMDKEEITAEARRIGTFDVSTLPDQDCCQLYVPKSPAIAATLAQVREAEAALDVPALVERRWRRQSRSASSSRRRRWALIRIDPLRSGEGSYGNGVAMSAASW